MTPIVLQSRFANDILELLEGKREAVSSQIASLTDELRSIDLQIDDLRKAIKGEVKIHNEVNGTTKYSNTFSWPKKIEFVLRQIGQPVVLKDIVDAILQLEPKLERKTVVASVSSNLSVKAKGPLPLYSKEIREGNQTFYGLEEWNGGGLM